MDAQRFDSLAKRLATRLSRRGALRGAGAAASAGLLATTGLRPASAAAQGNGQPVYTVMRRYTLDDGAAAVRQILQQGYLAAACTAPGFIAYLTVEDEDGDFVTVAVFGTEQDFSNFASAEANWVAQNLDNLLPAPDEVVAGQTYIYTGNPQAFVNTCPGGPQPTVGPAPTTAPAPSAPTPTAVPACTGQGCVCTTGTQAPCDSGLVCCPTTDLMGGPGICQTQDVCYPNQCTATGDGCPATCNWGDACPGCCTNFCNGGGQCDNPPTGCTGAGCGCTTGTQSPCDAGLICCGSSGVPGGPGVCTAQTDCGTPCTGTNCTCDPTNASSCDQGLTCCAVQSGYICIGSDQCGPAPCTDEGCPCQGGVQGACDDGLVCCQDGQTVPGGSGTCTAEANCGAAPCTGEGCACTGGVQGACDDGLMCCVQGDPGAPGTCQTLDACPGSLCTGDGCPCTAGDDSTCQDGFICCSGGGPGAAGVCQTQAECDAPNCIDIQGACDPSCNWGDSCAACCSGYCNSSGQCDFEPTACTGEGCDCPTGTDGACDDGLVCCQTTDDPGGPGVCQESC